MTLGNLYGLEIYYLVCVDKNRPQRIYINKYIKMIQRLHKGENIMKTHSQYLVHQYTNCRYETK